VGIIPAASPYQALAAAAPLERAMSDLGSVDCRAGSSFPVPSAPQKLDHLGPIAAVLWQIGPRFGGFSGSGCRSPACYEWADGCFRGRWICGLSAVIGGGGAVLTPERQGRRVISIHK
jgi:hypothetical protein